MSKKYRTKSLEISLKILFYNVNRMSNFFIYFLKFFSRILFFSLKTKILAQLSTKPCFKKVYILNLLASFMATINKNYDKLAAGYLFPEIAKRTKLFLEKNPNAVVMKLGIGNTTEPLTKMAIKGLLEGVKKLEVVETYSGYGDEQGNSELRELISKRYKKYGVSIESDEGFCG